MKPRSSTLFPVLLMLALALATLYLERLVQLATPAARPPARHEPDFIVEQFTVTRMNRNGAPESSLVAARMVHFPDDDVTELELPRIVQRTPGQPRIDAVAERGSITGEGEEIRLFGNVVIIRAGVDDRPPLRVETESLAVRPGENMARTDDRVVITEGSSRIEGVGMELNSKTRELELKSKVRGTLMPGER